MHRCYLTAERWNTTTVIPAPDECRHILQVLRASDGDRIFVFDGEGREAEAIVDTSSEESSLRLTLLTHKSVPQRDLRVTLVQAVLKGNRMDLLIEKATELGVARILPIITQRTIPRFSAEQARQKRDRWNRIAISAAKQCGTGWLPTIALPDSLENMLANELTSSGPHPLLLGSLEDRAQPLAATIDTFRGNSLSGVTIVIGPEGDFTADESQAFLEKGAIPVSLGELTLRAETAAMVAISVLRCMLDAPASSLKNL